MVMLYKRNILKFFVMMDFWIYIFYFDCLKNFFDFFDDYGIVIRECVGKKLYYDIEEDFKVFNDILRKESEF